MENVIKLFDNLKQAIDFKSSIKKRLLHHGMLDVYNRELRKFVDHGAIFRWARK